MKDLVIREEYQKDGETKTSWNKIGILIDAQNGKQYVKLYHMPGVLISVFEQKKKDAPIDAAPADWLDEDPNA